MGVDVVQQLVVEGDSELGVVGGDGDPLALGAADGTGSGTGGLDGGSLQVRLHALVEHLLGQVGKLLDQQPEGRLSQPVGACWGSQGFKFEYLRHHIC